MEDKYHVHAYHLLDFVVDFSAMLKRLKHFNADLFQFFIVHPFPLQVSDKS